MSGKFNKISNLYEETLTSIVETSDNWKKFLHTAGRIYKYPFNEQVLIFAQRPDAVACASMNIWNNNMLCWVKRGSKGIALIDIDNEKSNKLKYVFDVQDVYKLNNLSKLPYHWVYHDEHKDSIIDTLSEIFPFDYNGNSIVEAIVSLSESLVDDSLEDILEEISSVGTNEAFENVSAEEFRTIVKKEMASTIAYTTLVRCGVDLSDYSDYFSFDKIGLFNNESLLVLGEYSNQYTSDIMLVITNVIKRYNKERHISENAIENVENINYNEFSTLKRESEKVNFSFDERSENDENRVHSERRVSDSEYRGGSGAGGNTNEVGLDEENIHDRESQGSLFSMDGERSGENETLGNTGKSGEDVRHPSGTDDERGEHNESVETSGTSGMASESEQYQGESRGDSEDGADIHSSLNNANEPVQLQLFPSFDEQSGNVFMAVVNDNNIDTTAFSLDKNDELYNQIIRHYPVFSGYEFENQKYKFYELALMGISEESLAERIKQAYKGYKVGFLDENNAKMSLVYDDLSLLVAKGTSVYKAEPENEIDITYHEIAERIIELVKTGKYLSSEDSLIAKDKYVSELGETIADSIRELKEGCELPEVLQFKLFTYPDISEFYKNIVLDSEKRRELISFLKRDDLSFRFGYVKRRLPNIIEELELIDKGAVIETKPIKDENITEIGSFYITEDTIDGLIVPSRVETRAAIYEAYLEDDKKAIQNHLKDYFGDSGSASRSLHTMFSRGKGLELDQGYILEPFDKVKLSWSAITKRVIAIISEAPEDFISKADMEDYYLNKRINEFTSENREIVDRIAEIENDLSLVLEPEWRLTKHDGSHWNESYKATEQLLNWDVENDSYDKIISDYEDVIKEWESIADAWFEFGDYKFNIFRNSNLDWEFTLYESSGNEIDGGVCTDQQLRIDKAVPECLGLIGFADDKLPSLLKKVDEPEFLTLETSEGDLGFDLYKSIKNYNSFIKLIDKCPVSNLEDITFLKFKSKSESFMDLNIDIWQQKEGVFNIQMAHNYVQNGDLMDDPLIAFDIDTQTKKLIPREYQTSIPPRYESYPEKPTEESVVGQNDILSFMETWFNNIEGQDYYIERQSLEIPDFESTDGLESKICTSVTYNKNGKVAYLEDNDEEIIKYLGFKDSDFELAPNTTLSEKENNVISTIQAKNYKIIDSEIGLGTQKEKYQNNVKAIKLLKSLENENRNATVEEQEVLAKYVGWGGLADAFDENKSFWQNEYRELQEVLSPEEYDSARSSTLNAHYTQPKIIKAMYNALEKMGFNKGNILEPSMGVGNFFGCLPKTMDGSSLYGVELDDLSGRIAKKLYPNANIKISGFEETDYSNDFFDVAIGNVPFGDYKVNDRDYNNLNYNIHDYFFAKSLDKVRSGGIVAFITTKGTLDKKSSTVREYIAERADLIGAIRLPNTAFKANAGTEVTSDIIFLKKREVPSIKKPSWINTTQVGDVTINNYFADHPEMILGKMEMISGRFGMESACLPDGDFDKQLENAIEKIAENGFYEEVDLSDLSVDDEFDNMVIPAVSGATNFGHCVVDNNVYYRENSVMKLVDLTDNQKDRVIAMINIRDTAYEVLNYQLEDYSEEAITDKQTELNTLYDDFLDKYGYISSAPNQKTTTNEKLFKDDFGLPLLMSLENFDEDGNYLGKSAIFTERTVKKNYIPTTVDNSTEALALSLNEKGKVDINYMVELTDKAPSEIEKDLEGVIFVNPLTKEYESADEYLSGNVREKLEIAKEEQALHDVEGDSERGRYDSNVKSLEAVQPTPLDASEIEVRLGSRWIEPELIEQFMVEVLKTPQSYLSYGSIGVEYSEYTDTWYIKGKSKDYGNTLVHHTYGTSRVNAYKILEDTLNLKDIRIKDMVEVDGEEKPQLNQKETAIAQTKQEMLQEAFAEWIFKDIDRRNMLVERYNKLFNSMRPREYDGSILNFPGMSLDISLKDYQKNAVARMIYGGNTLLAHCVGAGKTFEMVTGAMESKRLGLCNKSLFVVPNHLTEQWGSDFLRLYPNAKVLVATKKDFTPLNRKRFISKIATGDYDAIIIGHTQFERIPLSLERQKITLKTQVEEIVNAISEVPSWERKSFSVKQMEKAKKTLETKLEKLNDSKKDDVVTFEQLGVDRLFVDESHYYKNLFMYTKMRNVSGITTTESKKSSDMYAKCMYLDEITGGKGITFATGTPISNTLSELYTNMKYLQNTTLRQMNLSSFDAWASTFAEPRTEMELSPEGSGYRLKTRLARFYNLPELVNVFKECADIQTSDMLNLPVPEAEYEDVVLEPSEFQKQMIESLAKRAQKVRDRVVDPKDDNMLKITNDGRFLALDERMINPDAIDDGNNKATACVEKAFEIWENTKEQRSTQLIFSDISTPKGDGTFSIYEDIRDKLIEKGVPAEEIAFIHDANTEKRKSDLFAKVRSGQVRFLFGSTQKLGAGTNVQDKLIALHHLDVPWRPSDIEQQEGRIIRRGNENEKVKIFRYIKKGTFDSYSWQLIEKKQRFISQIMTSKLPVRAADDIDEATLTYAEVKALATSNPLIKEKMELDNRFQKLKLARSNYQSQKYKLENEINLKYPKQIKNLEEHIKGLEKDCILASNNESASEDDFNITILDNDYSDKKEGAEALLNAIKVHGNFNEFKSIGYYKDFELVVRYEPFSKLKVLGLKGSATHQFNTSDSALGNITRIENAISKLPKDLEDARNRYDIVLSEFEDAKVEVEKPFPQEEEYLSVTGRLKQLELQLDLDAQNDDKKEEEALMSDDERLEKIESNIEKIKELTGTEDSKEESGKELVSEVEKGVIVEDMTPEKETRFNMYNEKDFIESKNKFAIYQLKDEKFDEYSIFRDYDDLKSNGFDVDRANYNLVYIGDYNPELTLEDLFDTLNNSRPFDYKGHSLSVSDIIVINDGVNITSHYCESFGFKNINDFIKPDTFLSSGVYNDKKEDSFVYNEDSEEVRMDKLRSTSDTQTQKDVLNEEPNEPGSGGYGGR